MFTIAFPTFIEAVDPLTAFSRKEAILHSLPVSNMRPRTCSSATSDRPSLSMIRFTLECTRSLYTMPQRPTCPYFQKGTCQYGPTCRLSHQLQPSSSSNNPFNPKRACTFYAQGRCTKGDQCTYLHPQTRTSSSTQSQNWRRGTEVKKADDSTPTNNAAAAPCAFFRKGKCAKGQECPFPHPEGQNPLCPFYLNGTCRFGSKCSSSHGGGAVDTPVVMPRAVREYKPIVIRSENTRDNVNPVPRPEFGAQRTIEAAKDSLPPVSTFPK